jgi:hypothetical protein
MGGIFYWCKRLQLCCFDVTGIGILYRMQLIRWSIDANYQSNVEVQALTVE